MTYRTHHSGAGYRVRLFQALLLVVTASLISCMSVAADSTYGSGLYGSCQYGGCSITVSSDGTVNLDVSPVAGGNCTVQSDSVGVLTDNSNGYVLSVTDSTTNTNLVNGSNTISASSGTYASPASLTTNSWGYRVDGLGSFGSGPTTAQSNTSASSISSLTFAGMAASNQTPVQLANTSSPADPAQTTTVWYGVCADQTQPNGTYSTQVTYTAITN
jgi:hypothetical protein